MFSRIRHYFKSWQDLVIGIGGFIFSVALLPTVLFGPTPPMTTSVTTSVTTAIVLWAFVIVFGSLHLRLSVVSTVLTAIMWTILAVQGLLLVGEI